MTHQLCINILHLISDFINFREESFKVVDYCSRALLRIDEESVSTGDTLKQGAVGIPTNKYMFSLILLENHQGKTVTFVCLAETE